jgi:hypothetical protein
MADFNSIGCKLGRRVVNLEEETEKKDYTTSSGRVFPNELWPEKGFSLDGRVFFTDE